MVGTDCLWLITLFLNSQKGKKIRFLNFMIDVYYNPIFSKRWSVGLFSIDYSPILKLTQPDLVLWYPKADSDKQETQKLTSAFNQN